MFHLRVRMIYVIFFGGGVKFIIILLHIDSSLINICENKTFSHIMMAKLPNNLK